MSAAADKAVAYLLRRISNDPTLAYHFDPVTESMALLTSAHAGATGQNVEAFRKEYYGQLRFVSPRCSKCRDAAAE